MMRSNSAAPKSSVRFWRPSMPALLKKPSMRPKRSSVAAT